MAARRSRLSGNRWADTKYDNTTITNGVEGSIKAGSKDR